MTFGEALDKHLKLGAEIQRRDSNYVLQLVDGPEPIILGIDNLGSADLLAEDWEALV